MTEKIEVVTLEDAIEVAINLINNYEYAYSIDDLVVDAETYMELRSFEIEKE